MERTRTCVIGEGGGRARPLNSSHHRSARVGRWSVGEHDVARIELAHTNEGERDATLQLLEERSTLAQHNRANHGA